VAEAESFRLLTGFSSAKIVDEAAFILTETWVDKA